MPKKSKSQRARDLSAWTELNELEEAMDQAIGLIELLSQSYAELYENSIANDKAGARAVGFLHLSWQTQERLHKAFSAAHAAWAAERKAI